MNQIQYVKNCETCEKFFKHMRYRASGGQDNPMGLVTGATILGKGYIRIVYSSSGAFEYLRWKDKLFDNVNLMEKVIKQDVETI